MLQAEKIVVVKDYCTECFETVDSLSEGAVVKVTYKEIDKAGSLLKSSTHHDLWCNRCIETAREDGRLSEII